MLKKTMFLCVALIAPVGLSIPAHAQGAAYYHPHMGRAWSGDYGPHRYPAYGAYRYGYHRSYGPYWGQGAAGYGYAYQPSDLGYYGSYDYNVDRFGLEAEGTKPPSR